MTLLALTGFAWLGLSLPVGLLLGGSMRSTGDREPALGGPIVVPDVIPAEVLASVAAHPHGRS